MLIFLEMRPRLTFLKSLIVCAGVCWQEPATSGALEESYTLGLPAQPLATALLEFGRQTRLNILIPTEIIPAITVAELDGEYTGASALDAILLNTGLDYQMMGDTVVAISRKVPESTNLGLAPTPPPSYEEVSVIGLPVTGSRIRRMDYQGSSPVDIISAPELARSGHQSLGDYLKNIPAVSGNSTSTAVSNGGDGTSKVTLRGLPANNTLVLINGQRMAFDGLAGDSVDLNSISTAAIERIEILKDGASAIYGADAIAGVVNIIMKNDYEGLRLDQYVGQSSYGDTRTSTTNLQWGLQRDRGGFLVSANYYRQEGLYSRERELSADADNRSVGGLDKRSSATPNSRVTLSNGQTVIYDPTSNSAGTGSTDAFRTATDEDLYNYRETTSSISPSERFDFYSSGYVDMTDAVTVTSSAMFGLTRASIDLASSPLFTTSEDPPVIVSADNIYNPFGEDLIDVRRRLIELGNRQQTNESEYLRFTLGLNGEASSLAWDANFIATRTEAEERLSGLVNGPHLARSLGPSSQCQGVSIDGCVPTNLFGPVGSITPDQVEYLSAERRSEGQSQLMGINANLTLPILALSAGDVELAAGLDLRREESKLIPSTTADYVVGGAAVATARGARNVAEAYVETAIPLLDDHAFADQLSLELAGRYSHYSDFGDNFAPKIGLRYYPFQDLLLRATYSKGFRAPSLNELHRSGNQSYEALDDPCANPANAGNLPGCALVSDPTLNQFLTEYRGDPELKPERSTSHTLGLFWTPSVAPGFSLSIDAYQIEQTDVIDTGAQYILDENARYGNYPDLVLRDDNGNLRKLLAPFINVGERSIRGLDISAHYQLQSAPLRLQANASHIEKFVIRNNQDSQARDMAGTFEDAATEGSGALPDWKANAGLLWTAGHWEANYTINFISSLQEYVEGQGWRRINSWTTHDVQMTTRLGEAAKLRVTLGIDNLLNRMPPFVATAFNDNYDARSYDIKGRFGYLQLSYQF